MKVLLFDIDATLILTGGAGLRALDRAFLELFAVDAVMANVAPHGKTDPAIIREIFHARLTGSTPTDPVITNILDSYISYLREEVELSDTYIILPGILPILEELTARPDTLLGLATGNVERGARIKLGRGNLNRFFSFGGFGSDSEQRADLVRHAAAMAVRRHGSPIDSRDIFVIGDTPRDVDAGKACGFRTIGVATGQYSLDQLRQAGADLTIPDFEQGRDQFLRTTFID